MHAGCYNEIIFFSYSEGTQLIKENFKKARYTVVFQPHGSGFKTKNSSIFAKLYHNDPRLADRRGCDCRQRKTQSFVRFGTSEVAYH